VCLVDVDQNRMHNPVVDAKIGPYVNSHHAAIMANFPFTAPARTHASDKMVHVKLVSE
jgi:hypothetical protein